MIINHNISALNTYRQLTNVNNATQKSLEKLSSGLRINRAGDDAAGLAISEKMRAQIRGLNMASKNAQDGISLIQTAEGALNETHSILQRMRELAVQAASDTNTTSDRAEIQKEIDELAKEITRISNTTEFNTQNLLNGGIQEGNLGELVFHIGANSDQNIALSINAMDAKTLGVARDIITATVSGAIDVIGAEVSTTGALGSNLVDGATLTLSTDATPAKPTVTINGVTVTTSENTSAYNGYTVNVVDGTTEGIEVNHNNKTITITQDISNTPTAASGLTVDVVGTPPDDTVDLVFTGTATAAGTDTLEDGLGNDEVKLTLTGTGSAMEDVIVKNTATSVSFTSNEFKGLTLKLDGSLSAGTAATIEVSLKTSSAAKYVGGKLTAEAFVAGGIDVSTQAAANAAITTIQNAIETVSAERSKLGAYQNRLEHTIANLGTAAENLTAAESRIRDVDMAKEIMEFTKNNIISQAAAAMLAQANAQPQLVLQLLR